MRKSWATLLAVCGFVLCLPLSASAQVNICWELAEPIWVPPTPLDGAECAEKNWALCLAGLAHCCTPTCRLHPECVLGGTFVDGHWEDLSCELMDPEVALEQFLRGHLRPADDFLEPVRLAAVAHIDGLMTQASPLPDHVQRLINDLMGANLLAGQPSFTRTHVADLLLLPEREPTADWYLSDPATEAITLDNLVIARNWIVDAIMREPVRSADDFYCGRVSRNFAQALSVILHELVHARQWHVLGRDTFLTNYLIEVLSTGYGNDSFESEAFRLQDFIDAQFVNVRRHAEHGWAFSDAATFAGTRTLSSGRGNSAGGSNAVRYLGTGNYELTFGGLADAGRGNVQVTSATPARHCKPAVWNSSGADFTVNVRCFDSAGAPADARFFATVEHQGRVCTGTSYLWSDRLTGTFTPDVRYAHNNTLAVHTMNRTATGQYTATLNGVPVAGGNVMVTAYGADASRCHVRSWGASGGRATVRIACVNGAGNPVDTRFSLRFSGSDVTGRRHDLALENEGAYLWADRPVSSTPYTPFGLYRFSHRAGDASIEQLGTGSYRVLLPSFGPEALSAGLEAVAYGTSANMCAITSRGASGTAARVDVACRDSRGAAVNTNFTLMLATEQFIPF